jgi:hypothetical protein
LIELYAAHWSEYNNGAKHVDQLFGYVNKMMGREVHWKRFGHEYPDLLKALGETPMNILEVSRVVWQKWLLEPLRDHLYGVIWSEFSLARTSDYSYQPAECVRFALGSFIDVSS